MTDNIEPGDCKHCQLMFGEPRTWESYSQSMTFNTTTGVWFHNIGSEQVPCPNQSKLKFGFWVENVQRVERRGTMLSDPNKLTQSPGRKHRLSHGWCGATGGHEFR